MQENQEQSQTQNKSLFLVSSAIHTRFGVYKKYERVEQTIDTCKSIRERVPDADIIILDGGEKDLAEDEKKLLSPYIDGFYSFADAENVKQVQKSKVILFFISSTIPTIPIVGVGKTGPSGF